jgi:TIR domain
MRAPRWYQGRAMADIFLSYAKEDREPARRIAKVLESCGWSVFWDRKITAGDNWREIVQSELDGAGAVVALWSYASVASTWVIEEAERGRRRLVSVLIGQAALPIGFGSVQAIDLIGWEGGRSEGITALVEAIAKTLQRPPQQAPRVPASPTQKRGIALAAGLVVALGAGALLVPRLSQSSPWMNQEIILDTSLGMNEAFDSGMSKLNAATGELGKLFFPVEDNLALRAFGGPCDNEGASHLLVPFGTNRRDQIASASSGVRPNGDATLLAAVNSALTDIQPLPHTRRVVVITGHADKCGYEDPIRELKKRLESLPKTAGQQPVELEMRFIGLGVPAKDAPKIRQISDAVGGQSYFVNTVAELKDVLQYVLEFEPALAHVKNVWSIVDEVGKSMSGVAQNMNTGKVADATRVLDTGQDQYASMRQSFDSLAGLQPSANFQRFYKLASENRVLQEQAFAAGRAWIRNGARPQDRESSGYEASVKKWNDLVGQWNNIIGKYNANINEMNRLTQQIVKEARRTA